MTSKTSMSPRSKAPYPCRIRHAHALDSPPRVSRSTSLNANPATQPRRNVDPPAGIDPQGNHRQHPPATRLDDVGQRGPPALNNSHRDGGSGAGAPASAREPRTDGRRPAGPAGRPNRGVGPPVQHAPPSARAGVADLGHDGRPAHRGPRRRRRMQARRPPATKARATGRSWSGLGAGPALHEHGGQAGDRAHQQARADRLGDNARCPDPVSASA